MKQKIELKFYNLSAKKILDYTLPYVPHAVASSNYF